MNYIRSTAVKLIAAILAVCAFSVSAISLFLVYNIASYGGYESSAKPNAVRNQMYAEQIYRDLDTVQTYFSLVLAESDWTEQLCREYAELYGADRSNFFFTVTDYDTEEVLLSNYSADYSYYIRMESYIGPAQYYDYEAEYYNYYESIGATEAAEFEETFSVQEDTNTDSAAVTGDSELRHVYICGYVRSDLSNAEDAYTQLSVIASQLTRIRYQAAMGAVVGGIAALSLFTYLMYISGRRTGTDAITLRILDRIPWDVFLALFGCAAAGGLVLGELCGVWNINANYQVTSQIRLAALTAAESSLWILCSMSFAARCKVRNWGRNSLIYFCWNGVGTLFHHPLRQLGYALTHLQLVWKTCLVGSAVIALEVACLFPFYWDSNLIPLIILNVIVVCFLLASVVNMKRLQQAAREIADGNTDYRVDTSQLFLDFRRHGEDLNRIGDGIAVSVEAKLKSERFKTELITNVSHDLKTPLTSIVNYADLLSRLSLPEEAQSYVEVLQRQSARLKKLTEDLVEASKASTGNIKMELEPINLGELLVQVTAEYADRFEGARVTPVVQVPEETVMVRGDGRYLWRIIDNLFSNVRKYAMPGTRVYIDVVTEENAAKISVKNISRERLNISTDELMKRFVRGDASRNTEGSGLGLSIAQSLAALMGGRLQIAVDGDLFKAELQLPLIHPEALPAAAEQMEEK